MERQGRPYSLKWVLKNKGEKVRARLVVNTRNLNRVMCFCNATSGVPEGIGQPRDNRMSGRTLVLAVFDVSRRALLRCVCECDVYVEPLAELHRPGLVAKLNKTMYGAQDASNAWQKLWGEHLHSNGFELGASNPALYSSELVNGFCHGRRFCDCGSRRSNRDLWKMLQEKFDTRRIGMIGAAKHLDEELEVLHRSVRVINDELMEIEADQKHCSSIAGRSWTHSRQYCQNSESETECY